MSDRVTKRYLYNGRPLARNVPIRTVRRWLTATWRFRLDSCSTLVIRHGMSVSCYLYAAANKIRGRYEPPKTDFVR